MGEIEAILFWITVGGYALASLTLFLALAFKKESLLRASHRMIILGLLFHTGTIASRWGETGHLPVMTTYENTLAGSWILLVLFQVLKRKLPLAGGEVALVPFSLLMLGYGVFSSPVLEPLTPPFQSAWLVIHVIFAWFAYSAYALTFALGILYLAGVFHQQKATHGRQAATGSADSAQGFFAFLPPPESLDTLSFKMAFFGFMSQTVMIAAGSIWASRLWGKYWSWDPIETWSLISWILYGIFLHLRTTLHWKGKGLAWYAILAFLLIILSFWGVKYVAPTVHVNWESPPTRVALAAPVFPALAPSAPAIARPLPLHPANIILNTGNFSMADLP